MHNAAETLSTTIQHGKGGLPHVQQLFLTAFWLKSAEKWIEAWYALNAAIRATCEIGRFNLRPEIHVPMLFLTPSRPSSRFLVRWYA